MPRRVTTDSLSRRAIAYLPHRRDSAVAQAFMVLSFVAAGLLLSVQFVYPKQSISDNSVPDNSVSDNSVSGNSVSGNSAPDNSVSGNSAPDNSVSDNSVSDNTASALMPTALPSPTPSSSTPSSSTPSSSTPSSSTPSSSTPSLPDTPPPSSPRPPVASTSQGVQNPSHGSETRQPTTASPSVQDVVQFLTGFSVIQHVIGWNPAVREQGTQAPKKKLAQLVPLFFLPNDNHLDGNPRNNRYVNRYPKPDTLHHEQSRQRLPSQVLAPASSPVSHPYTRRVDSQENPQDATLTPIVDAQTEPQTSVQTDPIAQEQAAIQIVVDLSDRQLVLYEQNVAIHTYAIAVGKAGWETPVGEFVVTDKEPSPTWRHPLTGALVSAGEDSPLGTRWIGFWTDGVHQIGFHGTNQAQSIGQAISHGCIRLQNSDIETLYPKVAVGTSILIQP